MRATLPAHWRFLMPWHGESGSIFYVTRDSWSDDIPPIASISKEDCIAQAWECEANETEN